MIMSKKEESILVNLDIETVTEVTNQYLMMLYDKLQKEITHFMSERIEHGPATMGAWEEYNEWHQRSQSIRELLRYTMSYEDYADFVEKTYKKYYHPLNKKS